MSVEAEPSVSIQEESSPLGDAATTEAPIQSNGSIQPNEPNAFVQDKPAKPATPGNKRPLVKGTPSKPGVVPSKPGVRPSISRPLQPKLSSSTGPPKATIGPVARKTAVGTTSVSKDPPSKPEASKPERPTHARTPSTVSSAPSTVRGRTTNAPVANGKTAPSKPATERKPITGPRPSVAAKAPLRSSVSGVKAPLKDNAGLDSLKEKLALSEQALQEKETKITELTQELSQAASAASTVQSQLDTLKTEADQALSQLTEAQSQLSEASARLSELESSVSGHMHEKTRLERSIEEAEAQLAEARTTLSKSEGDLTATREKHALAIAELTSEHGAEKTRMASASQDQLGALQTQLEALKSELAELKAEVSAGKEAQQEAESALQASKDEVKRLQNELEAVQASKVELEEQVKRLSDSTGGHSNQVRELEDQVKALEEIKSAQDESIRSLVEDVEKAHADKREALGKAIEAVDQAKQANDDAVAALKSGHQESIAEALREAEEHHSKVVAEQVELAKSESLNKIDGLRKDMDDQRLKEQDKLQKMLDEAKQETEQHKSASAGEVARLQDALQSLQRQYEEELSATKAEYGSKLEIAQQEALQEASQRHSSELAQLKDNSKKTIEEFLASHQAELESIKASHQKELESATAKTTSSLQSLQTDLSAASQDLSKAKWRNQELEATLKDMAANLQAAKEAQEAASKVEAPKDNKAEQKLLQLEQSLNAAQSESNELKDALRESQVSFNDATQELQKRHAEELRLKEERLVKQDAELQKRLDGLKHEHETIVQRLHKDLETKALPSPPASPSRVRVSSEAEKDRELVRLHHAHDQKVSELTAKLQQVEQENERLRRELSNQGKNGEEEEEFKYEA